MKPRNENLPSHHLVQGHYGELELNELPSATGHVSGSTFNWNGVDGWGYDLITVSGSFSGDHDDLTGLLDNDHPQYRLSGSFIEELPTQELDEELRLAPNGSGGVEWKVTVSGSTGGGIESGTSFPGTPTNDDLFYRTDRDLLYFYDGTRWLTTTLYEHYLGTWVGISATANGQSSAVWTADYDVWLVDMRATMYASSGLSGTAYWRIDLASYAGATPTAVATVNNQSGTSAVYARKKVVIGALLGTSVDALETQAVKVSTPGTFYGGAMVTYRLVG